MGKRRILARIRWLKALGGSYRCRHRSV